MKTTIQPLGEMVLVRVMQTSLTSGGLHLPDSAKMEGVVRARVVAIGTGVTKVCEGDVVCIGEARAHDVVMGGVKHTLVREDGILAVDLSAVDERETTTETLQ